MTHVIERTSPKGQAFIGRCRLCGASGLTFKSLQDRCPQATSPEEALLLAIEQPGAGEKKEGE